ncbi:hypothetical protein ime_138 [Escherichia phage ime]|jgi:hypothetical protein|uniref:Uncharacterized protein n=1 Tax=Escherichia phage ime TaxID=2696406 RepID=A0A6B9WLL5_9CAUD|nr:hypothetical protein ime_138 [Escherichia phage ime]
MKVKYLAEGMSRYFTLGEEYWPFTSNGDVYVKDNFGTPWFLHSNGLGYSIYHSAMSDTTLAEFV